MCKSTTSTSVVCLVLAFGLAWRTTARAQQRSDHTEYCAVPASRPGCAAPQRPAHGTITSIAAKQLVQLCYVEPRVAWRVGGGVRGGDGIIQTHVARDVPRLPAAAFVLRQREKAGSVLKTVDVRHPARQAANAARSGGGPLLKTGRAVRGGAR